MILHSNSYNDNLLAHLITYLTYVIYAKLIQYIFLLKWKCENSIYLAKCTTK